MTEYLSGERIIEMLLDDPDQFQKEGMAYELLQEYFKGLSIETLNPLINSKNNVVKRASIWILSEMGKEGCVLINEILPLLKINDQYIKYHALEIISICSFAEGVCNFLSVIYFMQDNDDVIRRLAMRLLSNANKSQLEACFRLIDSKCSSYIQHKYGLSMLLRGNTLEQQQVLRMINSDKQLIRKYGVILAKRLLSKFPDVIKYAMLNNDSDARNFSKEVLQAGQLQ